MQKVATSNGYDYYIGWDEKTGNFYNIVPENSPAPDGGYKKEYILGIKKVPDLFMPPVIELTKDEVKELKRAKNQLLTDQQATFTSNARSWATIKKVADKYNVDSQKIYDLIPN
jgi:hypothetical protein